MRKHQKRWLASAGATALSVAGLVAAGAPATAEHSPGGDPLTRPVVQQRASAYMIDGFEITRLPPGLDRYGIHSGTMSRAGERVSTISWVQGPDSVYGEVSVIRSADITELEDMRKARYGRLDDDSLEKTRHNGSPAYLSEKTGELFWVPERGAGVEAYLRPDRWESDELVSFAESVQRHRKAAEPEGEQEPEGTGQGEEQGGGAAGEEGSPGFAEAAAEPEQQESGEGGFVPGVSLMDVRTCLAEELPAENAETRPAEVAADDAALLELWRSVGTGIKDEAVQGCAERFGARTELVEQLMADLAAEAEGSDASGAQEGAEQPAAGGAAEDGAGSGDSAPVGLWDAIPWPLPSVSVR
ncbi:hypothetical protein ACFQZU_15150, partial [Streptomonospora algeriensis]